jgi:ribulose-5-phosphate 4-epimerase/fuculose-1-phosphate aldolase
MTTDQARVDLAAALRWSAKLNQGVANHFSLAINDSGSRFLKNPNQRHFSRIKASELIEIDVNDPEVLLSPRAF